MHEDKQTTTGASGAPSAISGEQQGAPAGVEMGQPHYSYVTPGVAPYQGAPVSGNPENTQPATAAQGQGAPASFQQPYMQAPPQQPYMQAPPQQPYMQAPPQQPYMQAPPQQPYMQAGPVSAPMNPYAGQAPAGMQPTAPPANGTLYAQGGSPPTQPQTAAPQTAYNPNYTDAQTAYTANPYPGQQAQPAPNQSQGAENRYGELYGLLNDAANGNPDVAGFLDFFQTSSSDFWKGALLGAGLALLLANDAVKSAITAGLGSAMGFMGGSAAAEAGEAAEDKKAEEELAKENK